MSVMMKKSQNCHIYIYEKKNEKKIKIKRLKNLSCIISEVCVEEMRLLGS